MLEFAGKQQWRIFAYPRLLTLMVEINVKGPIRRPHGVRLYHQTVLVGEVVWVGKANMAPPSERSNMACDH